MTTAAIPGVVDDIGSRSQEQLDKQVSTAMDKDKEAKIISWTKDAHQRCRSMRQQIERQWYTNLAFYIGRQNIASIPVGSSSSAAAGVRLYIPPAPYYKSRPVFNRIRPIVRKELAKLTAQKPSANVIPATSDEQDQAAAKAGEQIWDSVFRRKKLHGIHSQAQMWARTCGVGFVKSYWDPHAPDPDSSIPGDFCYDVVTPFHLFIPDMLAVDIEDQPYIIQITTRTSEYIKINYPGINAAPNVMEASDILNDSFLNLVGAGDFRKNAVMCYEVWIKPGNVGFMPQGGMFSIVGDRVVQFVEGNPYTHQQYPFCKLDNISTSRFYSDSVINDLIPVQREYNRTRGQIIENKNRMSHLQILAAEGSVDASKITTEPGQVIYYKLGYPAPTPMPVQAIPAYVIQEVQSQLLDFDDISGQHDVSKGQTPPGVTAATAINFLQEQDETMLASSFQSIESFYEKLAYQTLCYVKQYWDTPRMVKVSGQDKQFDVIAFQGSDLRSNTDIRIEAGSALPTSKSAKQALLMDLMSQQFISPEQGLELMEMGGTAELYEQLQVDTAQATRENMKMANVTPDIMNQYLQTFQPDPMAMQMQDPMQQQAPLIDPNRGGAPLTDVTGQPTEPPLIVPVNSFDNHAAHINTHNNYRKSQKYEDLAPEIKQLFEEHVNQHMQALGMPPGMPDPTTNQQIPMDQSQDPNASATSSSGGNTPPTGAPPMQSSQQGQGSPGMPPMGANIPNMM